MYRAFGSRQCCFRVGNSDFLLPAHLIGVFIPQSPGDYVRSLVRALVHFYFAARLWSGHRGDAALSEARGRASVARMSGAISGNLAFRCVHVARYALRGLIPALGPHSHIRDRRSYPRPENRPYPSQTLLTEGRHLEASWWWSRPDSGGRRCGP
jgi:hypothetical protein